MHDHHAPNPVLIRYRTQGEHALASLRREDTPPGMIVTGRNAANGLYRHGGRHDLELAGMLIARLCARRAQVEVADAVGALREAGAEVDDRQTSHAAAILAERYELEELGRLEAMRDTTYRAA